MKSEEERNYNYKEGKNDEALSYLKKALKIEKEKLPENHSEIGSTLCEIGNVYVDLMIYDEALEAYKQSFKIRKQILPKNHHLIAITLINIGHVNCYLNYHQAALNHYERSLEIRKERYQSENHPKIVKIRKYIESVYKNQWMCDKIREFDKASKNFERKSISSHLVLCRPKREK